MNAKVGDRRSEGGRGGPKRYNRVMGTFNIMLYAGDPERQRFEPVEALVDTGASYTMLPAPLLRSLGVPVTSRRPFVLASGQQITRDVGQTWVRIDAREVMTIVVFGDDAGPILLGAVTLEELGLGVDPLGRRLIEVPGLLT